MPPASAAAGAQGQLGSEVTGAAANGVFLMSRTREVFWSCFPL